MTVYRHCKVSSSDGFHYTASLPNAGRPFVYREEHRFFDLGWGYFEPCFDIGDEHEAAHRELIETNFGVDLSECPTFSLSDVFDKIFDSTLGIDAQERFSVLVDGVLPYFQYDQRNAEEYVISKLGNKSRASRARSLRFKRKAMLNKFTYFCTFTFDDSKCTWEEFNRQIRVYFMNKHNRDGWRVMMVPEFGKKTGRFHLHAVIAVPKSSCLPGSMKEYKRYNTEKKKMQIVHENSYFAQRWGFNDWQLLSSMNDDEMRHSVLYIIKYLGKTDSKAFYSRGIPTVLECDINKSDILVEFGANGALLFPGWHVWSQGKDLGRYSYSEHFPLFATTG